MTEQTKQEVLQFDTMQIMEMIPHRYPFLLVDRITECVPGKMCIRDSRNVDKQLDPALEYIPGVGSGKGVLKVVLSSGVNLYFWGKSAVMIDLNGRTKPNLPSRDIFIYTLVEPSDGSFVKAENFVPSGWNIWRSPVLGSDWHRNVYVNGYASYADYECKYRSKKDMTSIQTVSYTHLCKSRDFTGFNINAFRRVTMRNCV